MPPESSAPLTPEDLSMLYSDQPQQRTTMSMLMLLDRRPDPIRLRGAVWRAMEAMPRMRQCVEEVVSILRLRSVRIGRLVLKWLMAGGDPTSLRDTRTVSSDARVDSD